MPDEILAEPDARNEAQETIEWKMESYGILNEWLINDEGSLPVEIQAIAERELGETPCRRAAALKELRLLLEDETNLKSQTDTPFLLKFLRARKFNVDAALRILKNHYRVRFDNPRIFKDYLPEKIKYVYEYNCQMVVPRRDKNGRIILGIKFGAWNPSWFDATEVLRAGLMGIEHGLRDPVTQVTGAIVILDFKGLGLLQIRNFPPSYIKKVVFVAQDCLPARIKGIHVVNEPSLFNILFAVAKPFLKPKIAKRIHLHGYDMDSLHKFISPELLPDEYGGTNVIDNRDFFQHQCTYNEVIREENKYGYL